MVPHGLASAMLSPSGGAATVTHQARCSVKCEKATCTGCNAAYGPAPRFVLKRVADELKAHYLREEVRKSKPLGRAEEVRWKRHCAGGPGGVGGGGACDGGAGKVPPKRCLFLGRMPSEDGTRMCKIQFVAKPCSVATVPLAEVYRPEVQMDLSNSTVVPLLGEREREMRFRVQKVKRHVMLAGAGHGL
jgi:hypothetical protein